MPDLKFVGGRLCLDFVNTVGARVSQRTGKCGRDYADVVLREKLSSYADLLKWGQLGGAITPGEWRRLQQRAASHPQNAAAILSRAINYRDALYRIFKCVVEGWRPDDTDLQVLNNEVSLARTHERLVLSAGRFVWSWEDAGLDAVLWAVSRSAAELWTSQDLPRLRQCAGGECGWMFL